VGEVVVGGEGVVGEEGFVGGEVEVMGFLLPLALLVFPLFVDLPLFPLPLPIIITLLVVFLCCLNLFLSSSCNCLSFSALPSSPTPKRSSYASVWS